jgi:hypothetical protein
MQQEIDAIYRQKVEAYGLADKGFFNDEQELNERASRELDEFFNKKITSDMDKQVFDNLIYDKLDDRAGGTRRASRTQSNN